MKLSGRQSVVIGIVCGITVGLIFAATSKISIGIGVGCNVALFSAYGLWIGGDGDHRSSGKFGTMFATGVILLSLLGVQFYNAHGNGLLSVFTAWVLAFAGGLLGVAVGFIGTVAGVFKT